MIAPTVRDIVKRKKNLNDNLNALVSEETTDQSQGLRSKRLHGLGQATPLSWRPWMLRRGLALTGITTACKT